MSITTNSGAEVEIPAGAHHSSMGRTTSGPNRLALSQAKGRACGGSMRKGRIGSIRLATNADATPTTASGTSPRICGPTMARSRSTPGSKPLISRTGGFGGIAQGLFGLVPHLCGTPGCAHLGSPDAGARRPRAMPTSSGRLKHRHFCSRRWHLGRPI
jgi:hypothetical protein